MATLTWGECKELVEIALELDYTTQAIVNEIRRHTGRDLIESIHQVFGLLAVADHPKAEARYESMRSQFSKFRDSADWATARMKLKRHLPIRETM